MGGDWTWVSIKFNRTPRLHTLFDLRQFWQCGSPSSHFKCLSLHVRHPVRTLFGLFAAATADASAATLEPPAAFVVI